MNSKTNSDSNKKAMIKALRATLGVVSPACEMAGIARSTHYRWYDEDLNYKDCVDEVIEFQLDFVESKLFENINNNDTTATIFYLKTRARHRGYVERKETTVLFENPIFKEIDLDVIENNGSD